MTNQDMSRAMLAQVTRRRFLQRGGALGLGILAAPAVLAGCGGDDEPDQAAKSPQAGGAPEAPEASGRIDYLSWEGYDIPDALKDWKKANGIQVKTNYIATHDDIQAKIKAAGAGAGYDIITYYQGYKPLYAQLEILEPIDPEKLPNLENLADYWKGDLGNFWLDPDGTRTGVPWTWTTLGVTYDAAKIEAPGSYYDLLDSKFKGKVAIVDDPVGGFTLASHILGMKPDEVKKADHAKVSDLLAQMIAQSTGVSASFGDMTTKLTSGDAVVCFQGWTAMNKFAADAGTKTVKTVFPKEGGFTSCDCWAIPTTADNADAAYGWINESLDPKVHAAAADYVVGGVTVDAAYPLCSKSVQKLYPVEKLQESLEQAPLYNNPPVESDEFVTFEEVQKSWQELKAGGKG
jgi:spermidine/putrescine-binding protein